MPPARNLELTFVISTNIAPSIPGTANGYQLGSGLYRTFYSSWPTGEYKCIQAYLRRPCRIFRVITFGMLICECSYTVICNHPSVGFENRDFES